jgi:hypothetical protein
MRYRNSNIVLTESFYDITPYEAHWDIFKCLDPECVKKKSYDCYKWCDNWDEKGGSENCRLRCSDYADEQFDYLKFNDYTFNYLLPKFDKVTILKDDNEVPKLKNYFILDKEIPFEDRIKQ